MGTYNRAYQLALHLSELRNEVDLICASGKKFDSSISLENVNGNLRIYQLPVINGFSYFSTVVGGLYFTPLMHAVLNSLEIRVRKYDLVHCFQVSNPAVGVPTILSKTCKDKITITDRDDAWRNGFSRGFNPVKRLVWNTLEDYTSRIADAVTVASKYLYDRVLNLGMNNVYLLPNGSDIQGIEPVDKTAARNMLGMDLDSQVLISLGLYPEEKANINLFKVTSKVIEEIPNLTLIVTGAQEVPLKVNPFYRKISSNVQFVGYQSYDRLKYYLGASDAAVLPMSDAVVERARFPGRLGVYLAAGKPIVSNAVGEVAAILEKYGCGLTSEPSNIDAFAESIVRILRDGALQTKLGENARKIAENKYSWNKIAQSLDRLYDTLLK
jgi:glycosyltransferase involved in cell wall biosynthesis